MAFTASFSFYARLSPINSKRIWTYKSMPECKINICFKFTANGIATSKQCKKEALPTAHGTLNVYKYGNCI
jgi:hypothetical protein